MLIIEGGSMFKKKMTVVGDKVQDIGYRLFLCDIANNVGISNFDAKNSLKDKRLLEIFIGDLDPSKVNEVVEYLKEIFPEEAKVDKDKVKIDDYNGDVRNLDSYSRWLNGNQLTKIVNAGNMMIGKMDNLGVKIDNGFSKMDENFRDLDTKYRLISEGMFAIVNELKETNKTFEKRIEKTEKNIEELLKILVEKG